MKFLLTPFKLAAEMLPKVLVGRQDCLDKKGYRQDLSLQAILPAYSSFEGISVPVREVFLKTIRNRSICRLYRTTCLNC